MRLRRRVTIPGALAAAGLALLGAIGTGGCSATATPAPTATTPATTGQATTVAPTGNTNPSSSAFGLKTGDCITLGSWQAVQCGPKTMQIVGVFPADPSQNLANCKTIRKFAESFGVAEQKYDGPNYCLVSYESG